MSINVTSPVGCWLRCQEDENCQASSYDASTTSCCLFQSLLYEYGNQITECPSRVIGADLTLSKSFQIFSIIWMLRIIHHSGELELGVLGHDGLIQSVRSDTKDTCRRQCQLDMKCFCWVFINSICTLMSKCLEGISPSAGEILESMPAILKGLINNQIVFHCLTLNFFKGEDPLRVMMVFPASSINRIGKYLIYLQYNSKINIPEYGF